jgi:hypothetical protein
VDRPRLTSLTHEYLHPLGFEPNLALSPILGQTTHHNIIHSLNALRIARLPTLRGPFAADPILTKSTHASYHCFSPAAPKPTGHHFFPSGHFTTITNQRCPTGIDLLHQFPHGRNHDKPACLWSLLHRTLKIDRVAKFHSIIVLNMLSPCTNAFNERDEYLRRDNQNISGRVFSRLANDVTYLLWHPG